MNKTAWLIIGATILIIGGGIFLFSKNSGTKVPTDLALPSKPEFYWQVGCVHCENVEKFIDSWDKKDQLSWNKFDIRTGDNSQKMLARATSCKINPKNLGTPLLFTPNGKCIEGDTPIIEYLKNLIK